MKTCCVLVPLGLLLCGCGPKLLPGLEIALTDTPDHRALLKVVDSYREAFQGKNAEALAGLASTRFFDDGGTQSTSDDYNYTGIRSHFTDYFSKIKECSLDMQLKDVKVDGDAATIDYHYVTRYLMVLPSGERWQITDEVNRMELVRENGSWKILSGM